MNKLDLIKRIFRTQVKRHLTQFIIIFLFIIISAMATSAVAWLLDPAIKKIFIEKNRTLLVIIPALIILAFVIKSISTYIIRIKTIKISFNIIKNIQILMADKILKSDTSFIISKHSGKFISNFTNDTQILLNVINGIAITSVKEFVTLIALLGLMFYQNWQLSILAIIMIPVAAFFSKKFGKRMKKFVNQSLQASEVFTKFLSEILKSTTVIKIFQKEDKELDNFKNVIEDRVEKMTQVERTRLGATPIMETITGIAIAIVVFAGGYLSIKDEIEVGSFFSFLTALMLAYQPVRALASVNIGINEGLIAAKRIYELLDNQNNISNDPKKNNLVIKNKNIAFENVSFIYPDGTQALRNITFSIKGGSTIALVGKSGSGKSSFINLIPRFYNVSEGKISIDEQNINEVNLSSLRKEIALVSQETVLFDDTVEANIRYGRLDASKEEVLAASKNAAADEFIRELPNGYSTIIGENGVKLSGGQKQRISIARAMLKNSSIILLDEATSALDSESETKIKYAVDNLIKNRTTIIIAHRLSTIKNANKILVLSDGNLVAEGTHNELIEKSELYKKLYNQEIVE
ncbi:MAG: ABC transporter transmembrane domain-containing protein [Proteobacteria bacterium]|jgi:ATP-binding cassette, subfamily B, bacterial MsbA|nr:ABC transporter transmembrane domain-containing protein [Pseudomonadota bacterium]